MEEIDTSYLRNAYHYNKIALNKFDLVYYELNGSEKELVKEYIDTTKIKYYEWVGLKKNLTLDQKGLIKLAETTEAVLIVKVTDNIRTTNEMYKQNTMTIR